MNPTLLNIGECSLHKFIMVLPRGLMRLVATWSQLCWTLTTFLIHRKISYPEKHKFSTVATAWGPDLCVAACFPLATLHRPSLKGITMTTCNNCSLPPLVFSFNSNEECEHKIHHFTGSCRISLRQKSPKYCMTSMRQRRPALKATTLLACMVHWPCLKACCKTKLHT